MHLNQPQLEQAELRLTYPSSCPSSGLLMSKPSQPPDASPPFRTFAIPLPTAHFLVSPPGGIPFLEFWQPESPSPPNILFIGGLSLRLPTRSSTQFCCRGPD